ncbi:MAG: hypothetical protein JWN14_233, partial [Chthonomonadales bacterium]|nr:hypothetical protein [Chthonomonadales bacterium]
PVELIVMTRCMGERFPGQIVRFWKISNISKDDIENSLLIFGHKSIEALFLLYSQRASYARTNDRAMIGMTHLCRKQGDIL